MHSFSYKTLEVVSTYYISDFYCEVPLLILSISLCFGYHRYDSQLRYLAPPTFKGHIQFSSVAQSCLTLCDPMNHSMPGLPVHHILPEFTQTHAHRVGDAIQISHPLLSPFPPAPNPSKHQGLFQ